MYFAVTVPTKSENLSGDEIGKAVMKTAEKEFSYLMTAQSVKAEASS